VSSPEKSRSTRDLVGVAARNNAEWCDVVCRAHGLSPRLGSGAWTSDQRTPAGFPDAVTLTTAVSAQRLLSNIDVSDGCSVKDSFAELDLSPHDFRVLFEAQWIAGPQVLENIPASSPRWAVVDDVDEWLAAQPDPLIESDSMRRGLLDDSVCALLARDAGEVVAGAVITCGGDAVGISNVFVKAGDPAAHWRCALAAVCARHPTLLIVGYEQGPMLAAAREAGCLPLGRLRVWTL
jgi:hypothetical protein